MNETLKLPFDTFQTLLRYGLIVYFMKSGMSVELQDAYLDFAGAAATVIWGLAASGYISRGLTLVKSWLNKAEAVIEDIEGK